MTNIKEKKSLLKPDDENHDKKIDVKTWEKQYHELKKEMYKQLYENRVIISKKQNSKIDK